MFLKFKTKKHYLMIINIFNLKYLNHAIITIIEIIIFIYVGMNLNIYLII